MTQNEPIYFTEFKKELFGKFGEIDKRFNGLEEQIGDLSVKVTSLQEDVKEIKGEIKAANGRMDRHSQEILIGLKKLDNHETRIDQLEKEIA
jgi:chromosome segregation ATPase